MWVTTSWLTTILGQSMSEKLTRWEVDMIEQAMDTRNLSPRASGDIDRILYKLRQLVEDNA